MLRLNRPFPSRFSSIASASAVTIALLLASRGVVAQDSSSSGSSSSQTGASSDSGPQARVARIAQANTAGSAITLETSEPLFFLAASLNACGYDAGMDESSPIRGKVREEMNEQLAGSAPARDARDALCAYIRLHALNDKGQSLAQYVSLSLFLSPPPELAPTVDETDLPPDASQVLGILPLVRAFAEGVHLNALWAEHHTQYDALVDLVHDPLTRMVLDTNIYLRLPVSSYDGRRLLVLLEPMLAPSETNARIYANDFVVVVSPKNEPPGSVPMDLIRHTYLHYEVEPLVYARASAMDRLLPLLKPVQQAPLDFTYKADIVALLTECLIKAIEAQTLDVGFPKPARPVGTKERADLERFDADMAVYNRKSEALRRQLVERDMRQGWVLVEYFYNQLGEMDKNPVSLKDNIGPMIYGMDVNRERHHDEQIAFLPEGPGGGDFVRRAPRQLAGMDLAEMKLMKGDADGAEEMADAALKTDPANSQAHYLLGRIDLMEGDPDSALDHLNQTLKLSHDPRTVAWAHIYLGRLYDIARDPENPEAIEPQRDKAVAEYRAALANRDSQPDTKAAAEKGIKEPFALPKRAVGPGDSPDAPLDPSGKAEKEAYRPPPSQ